MSLARSGEYSAAASTVNVSYQTILAHRKSNPEFALACKQAEGELDEKMMEVVFKLAIEGVIETKFDPVTGKKISEKRIFNDKILLKWLGRRKPEQWGAKIAVNATVESKVEHTVKIIAPKDLTKTSRNRMRDFLDTVEN